LGNNYPVSRSFIYYEFNHDFRLLEMIYMWHLARNRKGSSRKNNGSQMAELPPALFILFVAVFFPLLSMFYIFLAYCAGWYLNQIELRQVACQTPQPLTPPANGSSNYTGKTYTGINIPQSQNWNGFLGVVETSEPQVTYLPGPDKTSSQVGQAQVTTTVSVAPFLSQGPSGWLPKVPGLNEPLTFVYTNTILQEDH